MRPDNEYLLKNPVAKVKFLKEKQKKIVYWTKSECSLFLQRVKDDHYHDLYFLTISIGLRLGEVTGLCWNCIDFKNRQIQIKRKMTASGLDESTKSKKIRFVPMTDEVYDLLLRRSKKKESLQFVFTDKKVAILICAGLGLPINVHLFSLAPIMSFAVIVLFTG